MSFDALTDDERTSAFGLARFSSEYLESARLIAHRHFEQRGEDAVAPFTAYFLAAHSIELSLKAFLRHNGFTVKALRSRALGHDLTACYQKAKEIGLLASFEEREEDKSVVVLMTEWNEELRYIRTGFRQLPSWTTIESFAARLQRVVRSLVGADR